MQLAVAHWLQGKATMEKPSIQDLFDRLRNDPKFRDAFAAAPRTVLAENGYPTDQFNLPERFDSDDLERRLNAASQAPADVWSALAPSESDSPISIVGMTVAVVIYGTAPVIGGDPGQVVVGGFVLPGASAAAPPESAQALQALRQLSRLPKQSLRFAIRGPDGQVADNLSLDVIQAFLSREDG